MARKKKQAAATDTVVKPEVGSFAQAVLDGRNVDSKSSQKDWLRLVQAHRKGEFVPMSLVDEVYESAGYRGDAYTKLLNDAKDLAVWQRCSNAPSRPLENFKEEHGTRQDLEEQRKALKAELESVEKLLQKYDATFHGDAVTHKRAEAIQRTNKRLFPGGAISLLQEAGIR